MLDRRYDRVIGILVLATFALVARGNRPSWAEKASPEEQAAPYANWKNGPGTSGGFFPIAVWLQSPRNAPDYKAIGINLYVGLWNGPTAQQINELKRHGIRVVCSQNEYALGNLEEKAIVAWMHGDEPDNAQSLGSGKGYGPPVPPARIVEDYRQIKAKDSTRPVLLNLGQGVAWDGWHGRGVRTNHPEDYAEYIGGCDIASFDIYPAVHTKPEVAGKLWYVPRGVYRLREWTTDSQIVWNCIECTRISNTEVKPTPDQVKAEVWMALIHGSRGLIYFCHQFQPKFVEAGLLADSEMCAAVSRINRRIRQLAPVLNSATLPRAVDVAADPSSVSSELRKAMPAGPIATMVKRRGKATYLFAVRMEDTPVRATFKLADASNDARVEVLDEKRDVELTNGSFKDDFGPYQVHLYRIQ